MKSIKVYCDRDYPPFDFEDQNKEPSGFDVDITRKIAEIMGFDVEFEMTEWDNALRLSSSDENSVIHSIAKSSVRGSRFDFTKEYITAFNTIFVLRKKGIKSVNELAGRRVAVQRDDIGNEIVGKIRNTKVLGVTSQADALRMLYREEVDAIAGNRMTVIYYAGLMNISQELMSMGDPVKVTKISVGVSKNRPDILALFDEGIERVKKDGSYRAIYDRWFGEQLRNVDRHIIDCVETGIICISSLGNITAMNKTACKIFDIESKDNMLKSVYESDIIKFIDGIVIENALDNMESSYHRETAYVIGGKRKDLAISLMPIPSGRNNIAGVMINIKDITKEKLAERDLITRDKMESLGRLILNVAHEIRNPLTSIKNFISLIPDNIDDEEFRETLLNHVPRQIDLMDKILKELLEYSSPAEPERLCIDVAEAVESVIKLMKPGKQVHIKRALETELFIRVDEKHFRQILINIILNSIDAIGDQGEILIESESKEGDAYLYITDSGSGIPEKDLDHIFDPFFTTKPKGTGLGLYITYRLIKENSGDIFIESSEAGTKTVLKFICGTGCGQEVAE